MSLRLWPCVAGGLTTLLFAAGGVGAVAGAADRSSAIACMGATTQMTPIKLKQTRLMSAADPYAPPFPAHHGAQPSKCASALEAPTEAAGGMAAPILTHTNRQAASRLLRRRIRIGREVGSPYNRRAFGRSVRVREVNIVAARRLRGGRVACLRLRRVRSRGLQQLRGQVLGRRLRPGHSARETCNHHAKAFHCSALNPRPPQALLRIVNQT